MNYLIPAILAFSVGLTLWLIKRERHSMEYEIIGSQIFPHEMGGGKYFVININNSGNRPAENVSLKITFDAGRIGSFTFSDQDLIKEVIREDSQLSGSIPLLNQGEKFEITITVFDEKSIISTPTIIARGKGVTAVKKSPDSRVNKIRQQLLFVSVLIPSLLFIGFVSYILYFYKPKLDKETEVRSKEYIDRIKKMDEQDIEDNKRNIEDKKRMEIEEKEIEAGKPETQEMVFAVLNRSGLGHLSNNLISSMESVTYFKTSLFLMNRFLLDEKNGDKYVKALKDLVTIQEMRPSSRGFIQYLIGKMEQFKGNHVQARHYFDLCKKETPLMYEHLMAQDSFYDLTKIQKSLKNIPK